MAQQGEMRDAVIVFADFIGSTTVADERSVQEYAWIVDEFHGKCLEAKQQAFSGMSEPEQLEFDLRGDQACLIVHSPSGVKGDLKKSLGFVVLLKMLWVLSKYNSRRMRDDLLPRDVAVGINIGKVSFRPRPRSGSEPSSEGFAISLAKRVEGATREGSETRVTVSETARYHMQNLGVPEAEFEALQAEMKALTPRKHFAFEVKSVYPILEVIPSATLATPDARTMGQIRKIALKYRHEAWPKGLSATFDRARGLQLTGLALQMGDRRALARAAALFKKTASLAPEWWKAHNDSGEVQYFRERWPSAVASFREALKLRRDAFQPWGNLAMVQFKMSNEAESRECLAQCLRLNPDATQATDRWNLAEDVATLPYYAEVLRQVRRER